MFEAVWKLSSQGLFSMLAFDNRWFRKFRLLFQTMSILDLSTGKGMAISIASVCIQLFERTTARFYPSQVTILHTSTLFRDWYEYYYILWSIWVPCVRVYISHTHVFSPLLISVRDSEELDRPKMGGGAEGASCLRVLIGQSPSVSQITATR